MNAYRRKFFRSSLQSFLSLFLIILASCGEKPDPNIVTASGNIEATEVTVSSMTAGRIESFEVGEGSEVKAGDVIAKLDHSLLDVQLRQSQANVEQAEAQLRLLQSGARKEDIKIAQEQVELAEINLQQAKDDKDRLQQLVETNTITRKQYDDAATKYDLAATQLKTAKENLIKVKSIIRPEEIESAKANLKKAKAGVDLILKNIEDCTVTAPVSGTVTKKFSETGEYMTPGASLLNIADMSVVDLKIYVNGEELGKVKTGQTASVATDSYKGKSYEGNVIYISPEAQFTPKNIQTKEERTKLVYEVKIRIPNPDRELKSGMPADATIRFD